MALDFMDDRKIKDAGAQDVELDEVDEKETDFGTELLVEEESAEEEVSEGAETSSGNSSVQQYLHEIGSVPLLSREREVELAVQMEQGRKLIIDALFSIPAVVRHVLQLGAAVSAGDLELRQVVEKSDTDEEENTDVLDPRPFLKLIAKLRRLSQKQ